MSEVLEIIKDFCYGINIPAPTSIASATSPTELQYISILRLIGENLLSRPYQWPQLKRGYTFQTQTGVSKYQLPGDFYRILDSSQWDVTNNWPLRGPVSDFQFTTRQFAAVSLQTRKAYRIVGPVDTINYGTPSPFLSRSQGFIEIEPAADNNTDELYIGYLSRQWIMPRDWKVSTAYLVDDFVTGADGRIYRCTTAGTSGATAASIPSVTTGTQTDGTAVWGIWLGGYNLRYGLRDDDRCVFDDELMIGGMRWAYYRAKRQEYMQERTDWDQMVKNAYARFQGPVRISMAGEDGDYFDWPNVPAGSWSV